MPTIAFTDDDVRVADDWIGTIAQALNDDGDVSYVGGRVLPRWLAPPPRWLTTAHWSPLALQDYGAAPLVCSRERAICLVGANLAFKREVFDRVGGFAPELGRVRDGIGSTEDHEMQLRVWRAGLRGRYDPRIVAIADVTPDRIFVILGDMHLPVITSLSDTFGPRWGRQPGNNASDGDMVQNDAIDWYSNYAGADVSGNHNRQGGDIFEQAGPDLTEFVRLLNAFTAFPLHLMQLGDMIDLWIGLEQGEGFGTIGGKGKLQFSVSDLPAKFLTNHQF